MGFSNAIYRYPKYKDTIMSQVFAIEDFYDYDNSEWAKEHYNSAKEYMNSQHNQYKDYIEPTQDQIDYYKDYIHDDEFNIGVISNIVYDNCSGGISLDEDIRALFNVKETTSGVSIDFTQAQVIKLLAYEIKKLDKYRLVPANINYAFTKQSEDEDDDEDESIVLKRCDGVEILYEDGVTRRIYTNQMYDDWGVELMAPKTYIDDRAYDNLMYAIETLSSILETTDFDKEVLHYSGGW